MFSIIFDAGRYHKKVSMKYCYLLLIFFPVFTSCKSKKKEPAKKYISVLSLIKSQVAHVDTSLYPIIRLDMKDSLHTDTTYIPREQFAALANDFLTIPDLADKKMAARYKEEVIYDQGYNRASIIYSPLDPKNEEVQLLQLIADPNEPADNNVKSIIIKKVIENRDSSVSKNLFWQMNNSFQIVTVSQKPGQPETTTVMKVTWNQDKYP
jgi:hypothetical protein